MTAFQAYAGSPDIHYTGPDLPSFLPISSKHTLTKREREALEWKPHWTCLPAPTARRPPWPWVPLVRFNRVNTCGSGSNFADTYRR